MASWSRLIKNDFTKRALLYGYYLLLVWLIHIFLVSGAAFFHFLLGHRLGVVEDWIFDRGWELLIITKISAVAVFSKYVAIGEDTKKMVNTFFREGSIVPVKEVYVLIFFSVAMFFWRGQVTTVSHPWPGITRMLVSWIGVFIFYMSDIYVLSLISRRFPYNYLQKNLALFFYPIFFLLVNKLVFMYATNIGSLVFFAIFFGMYLSRWTKINWSVPALFIGIAICPISTFFGEDPMWGEAFSPWGLKRQLPWFEYFVIGLIGAVYLFLKKHRMKDVRRYLKLKIKKIFA